MAREFILFVHICHWIGGRTAVPFKTSPGLLTACHRGEMKTSGDGGGRRPPGGRTHLTVYWDFYLLPRTQTFFLSSLESTFQEEPPNMDARTVRAWLPTAPIRGLPNRSVRSAVERTQAVEAGAQTPASLLSHPVSLLAKQLTTLGLTFSICKMASWTRNFFSQVFVQNTLFRTHLYKITLYGTD